MDNTDLINPFRFLEVIDGAIEIVSCWRSPAFTDTGNCKFKLHICVFSHVFKGNLLLYENILVNVIYNYLHYVIERRFLFKQTKKLIFKSSCDLVSSTPHTLSHIHY